MAEMRRLFFWRHLRSEMSAHILYAHRGAQSRSGRGLSFWFVPLSASVSELPMEDRELPVMFKARSRDFQEVSVQGVLTWRVTDPAKLAARIDFTIDLATGQWRKQPLEKIAQLLTEQANQLAWTYLAGTDLADALVSAGRRVRELLAERLAAEADLVGLGIEIVSVAITATRPTAEVERALQMPAREAIQQLADKATFARRAVAVERERAIAENELQNKIELAKREQVLIDQEALNEMRRAQEAAARQRVGAAADADCARLQEASRADAERTRADLYRNLPPHVLLGLVARDLPGGLPAVEHLAITPDLLGPALARLARDSETRAPADQKEA
ncbi:MAG: hypothetical protein HYV63_24815 [Candidatus Schekmanbacteria bacterium]|nr:hypothetical protein [Candidatus Schekmanbacteria bacterium]